MATRVILIAGLVALAATQVCALQVWDAVEQFPTNENHSNPFGVWTYGSGGNLEEGYTVTPFTVWLGGTVPIGYYHTSAAYGFVLCNPTDTDQAPWKAKSLGLCPGDGVDFAFTVVRWTAPIDGIFKLDAWWQEMGAAYWGSADLRVLVNGSEKFNYYKPSSNGVDIAPPVEYTGEFAMQAGDTVDFAYGCGLSYNSDWLTARYVVSEIPEPASILALMAGLGGLAGFVRRRA